MYKKYFKCIFDLVFSISAFLILLPISTIVALILIVNNGGSPFFFQSRPGKNCKVFKVIKFKTMNDKKGSSGELLPDAQRLTPIGSFIRRSSLDEIPQLLNIIKGDMSLIGPRPLLVNYLPYYSHLEMKRFDVRPGITGLAQISGRNLLNWDERLALDVKYVNTLSISLDVRIFFSTIINIFTSKGTVADPTSIMQNFDDERKNSNKKN